MGPTRSIIVGVDGTDSSRDALDWAAAEAATRHLPLRVVHAYTPAPSWVALGSVPCPAEETSGADLAGLVVEEAVSRARSVADEIEVSTHLVIGAGAPAMLAHCGEADLLVLGSRGLGGVRSLLSGSVSFRIAMRATCPVVVVRPMRPVAPGPSATRVVVGVDGSERSQGAIRYAVNAAAQRGVGVTAVHAWIPRGPADFEAVTDDWSLREAAEWRAFQAAFVEWQHLFAGTDIELRLVEGRTQDGLVAESAGAALLVIGSGGRGGMRAALRGSVSQAVLQHAACPVVVVR